LTSVRQTCTMFYVENLFIFLPQHFLQNSLSGFLQLPQLRNSTMVELEGSPPPSAAASHRKVSHRHCGQVGFFFSPDRALFALFASFCFFLLFRHRHCLSSSPDLSSFLNSLSCCLLVVAYSSAADLGWLHSLAPVLSGAPSRSCSSASVVLLLDPFLGRGGAPARSLPWPRWCSCLVTSSASAVLGSSASPWCSSSAPCLRLGAPHETFGLASVLLLGSSASPWFSSSAPVLGPMTRCSARNLRPCAGSPPWLLGLALVLILGPIPRPRRCSSVPFFGPIPWRCFNAPHETLGCAPAPQSRCPVPLPGSNWSHRAPHETLSSPFLSLGAPIR
jgi:hypothetical protein